MMNKNITITVGALLAGLTLAGCGHSKAPSGTPPPAEVANSPEPQSGTVAQGAPILPDPAKTPGATLPVTASDICVSGYSSKVRNVPSSVKNQVYESYGITHRHPREFEIDHLISLELGGSNSVKNLWPESFETQPWNAHVKDQLENALHSDVCSGQTDLATAQREIATDWIAAYKKRFGTNAPVSQAGDSYHSHRGKNEGSAAGAGSNTEGNASYETDSDGPAAQSGGGSQVWVNLNSGKYWEPGSQYYGKTKHGEYLTRAQAEQQGYAPAKGQ